MLNKKTILAATAVSALVLFTNNSFAVTNNQERVEKETVYTSDFNFDAYLENNIVYTSWKNINADEGFAYYKLMISKNENPTYPKEPAMVVLDDESQTEYKIEWPKRGENNYRICMVVKDESVVYCSKNVVSIDFEPNYKEKYTEEVNTSKEELKKLKDEYKEKLDTIKEEYKEKLESWEYNTEDLKKEFEEKVKEVKWDADEKVDSIKSNVKEKVSEVKKENEIRKEKFSIKREEMKEERNSFIERRKEARKDYNLSEKLTERLEVKLDSVYKRLESSTIDTEKRIQILEKFINKLEEKYSENDRLKDVLEVIIWDIKIKIEEYNSEETEVSEDDIDSIIKELN